MYVYTTQIQCIGPICAQGATLSEDCQCIGPFATQSTCPFGFTPVEDFFGRCSCEKKTQPQCPSGLSLYGGDCRCTGTSTCPLGSTLSPPSSGSCNCMAEPYCPFGAHLHHCKCVRERARQCSSGTLSQNGCECETSLPPKCTDPCELNEDICRCTPPESESSKISYYTCVTVTACENSHNLKSCFL